MYVISFLVAGEWRGEVDSYDSLLGAMTDARDTVEQTTGLHGWRVLDADRLTAGEAPDCCVVVSNFPHSSYPIKGR